MSGPGDAASNARPLGLGEESRYWALAFRIVVLAVAVGVALWLVVVLRGVLLQLIFALILASGLSRPVDRLQERGIPRGPSVLLIYLTLLLLLVLGGALVVPPVVHEIDEALHAAPMYGELAASWLRNLRAWLPFLPPLDEQVLAQVQSLGMQIGTIASQALVVARFAMGFFNGVLTTIFILLVTLYVVADGPRIRDYVLSFAPSHRRPLLRAVVERIMERSGGWLMGQLTLSGIIGLMSFVGLSVIGVPAAVLLALVAAVGEAIPMIGPIASAVPAIVVAATVSPTHALLTAVLYLLIQQLENNLIVPRVMVRAVQLHPLGVVLALLVGGELMGVAGAIVAIPVAAAVAVILNEFRDVSAPPAAPTTPLAPAESRPLEVVASSPAQ